MTDVDEQYEDNAPRAGDLHVYGGQHRRTLVEHHCSIGLELPLNAVMSMAKTLDDNFSDWESSAFGFGYGSGEPHTIPAIKRFLELCNRERDQYDYAVLEQELGPTVTWLLISALCKADILEYCTSPRYAWLTDKGRALKAFMLSKSDDELVMLGCRDSDYTPCYPDACHCGPDGYKKDLVCANPFWGVDRRFVNR